MAPTSAFVVLQLSHHGRTGDVFYGGHGGGGFSPLARTFVSNSMGALAAYAELSISLYCQHRRVDYRRDWTPALDRLRADSHRGGLFYVGFSGKQPLYTPGIHGNVHCAVDFVHYS